MLQSLKILISPFISLGFLMLSAGFFNTFTTLRLSELGYSDVMIGWVNSSYYAGFLLGSIKVEKIISRIKHIRAFAVFASMQTVFLLIQGLWVGVWEWIAIRFLVGVAIAALYVVIESWFLVVTPTAIRGRILAFYMVSLYSCLSVSQYILDVVDVNTLEPYVIAALLSTLAVIPVTLTKTTVPDLQEPMTGAIWKMVLLTPAGVTGSLVSGMILGAIYSFLPIFAENALYSVSIIMSLCIGGGFFFQWPVGLLTDAFSRRAVLSYLAVLSILPCLLLVFFNDHYLTVLIATFLLGGFSFTIYPTSVSHACDYLKADHLTSATGVLTLAYGVGAIIGPLACPLFMEKSELGGLFIFIACSSVLLLIVSLLSAVLQKAVPMEEKSHLIPLPAQTPLTYEMEPKD